jgi:hypothetical protein
MKRLVLSAIHQYEMDYKPLEITCQEFRLGDSWSLTLLVNMYLISMSTIRSKVYSIYKRISAHENSNYPVKELRGFAS